MTERERREKIAHDLAAFKKRGGKIHRIPRGVSGQKSYSGRKGITMALSGSSKPMEQHCWRQIQRRLSIE